MAINGQYRVGKTVVLRDEHRLFDCGYYLVVNPPSGASWIFDEQAYSLLLYLLQPRSLEEMEAYRTSLPQGAPFSQPQQLSQLLLTLQRLGIIEQLPPGSNPLPGPAAAATPRAWRYPPASAPLSVAVQLPLVDELLPALIAQLDQMGVLNVRFLGGGEAAAALLAAKSGLSALRANALLRLERAIIDDAMLEQLVSLNELRRGRLRLVVELTDNSGEWGELGSTLTKRRISYFVVYHVSPVSEQAKLAKVAYEAIAASAGYVQFIVDADHFASGKPMDFAAVTEQLAMLRRIQDSQPGAAIYITLLHAPVAKGNVHPEPLVKQLLRSPTGGCRLGNLIPPATGGATDSKVNLGFPTPEGAEAAGPELPPNCCQAGLTHLAIDRAGNVYPCEQAFGLAGLVMGHLREKSLPEIWQSENWRFFRGGWDLYQLSGCYACDYYISCASRRCRVHALKQLGSLYAPLPLCVRCAAAFKLVDKNITQLLEEVPASRVADTAVTG